MFYSHTFLARKSPLGIVWIAAHLDHKLKRPQIESINIPSYAEKIMMPDVPIALRLSGHLLIGIVRIYSWKVNHVYSDCNKLVSYIRKAFASVPVDLPIEADHAPFESVTLPETFDLNTMGLDESYYRTDEPDKHVKSYNQITMTDQIPVEEEQYVAVCISEENGLNLSPRLSNGLNLSPQPKNVFISSPQTTNISPVSRQLEDDILPPFERGFESIFSSQEHTPLNVKVPTQNEKNTPQGALDIENMRCDPGHLPQYLSAPGDFQIGQDSSPTINKRQSLSTIPENISILERDSSNGAEQLFNTSQIKLNFPDLEASTVIRTPVLNPKPAFPIKRRNVKKRKRIQAFDKQVVLSNMQMKKQLGESANIVCKRRKLPCSDLAVWKLQRFHTKEDIFDMPLLSRMNTSLVEALERAYPCSLEAAAPEKEMGTIVVDAQPTTPTINAFSDIEKGRDGDNMEDLIPQFTLIESDFGSELLKEKNSETLLKSANEISSPVEPIRLNLETPPFHLRELHLDDTEVPEAPGLLDSADEDLNFLNANEASPGLRNAFDVENLSSRTR
ncbi:sister chromatid cohesion 1 protein 3-like [Phalaenopsis equestris]|uniref:sister chromatid cohesion 1 protein 3-like n=1 Tax=Phalaenopsis equestris TaxID=78828 RepID=UPI0009E5D52C|nr:sister chromatid cohesion 1 protein 3-like [Phalaenopsis equestris]